MIIPVVEVGHGEYCRAAFVVVNQGLWGSPFAQAEAVQTASSR